MLCSNQYAVIVNNHTKNTHPLSNELILAIVEDITELT
jgi:hypothetical protein